jgi:hypothetical protein
MPWFIINTDMGYCGTETTEIAEFEDAFDAETWGIEEAYSKISVDVVGPFDSKEEAENV